MEYFSQPVNRSFVTIFGYKNYLSLRFQRLRGSEEQPRKNLAAKKVGQCFQPVSGEPSLRDRLLYSTAMKWQLRDIRRERAQNAQKE